MKQGVALITGAAEAHGTYARSEIRPLLQRSMFTNVSIQLQIRSPWVPASEAATLQHPRRLIPVQETLSALRHNGPTFPPCHHPSLRGEDPLLCTLSFHSPPPPGRQTRSFFSLLLFPTAELWGHQGLQPHRACSKRGV